MDIITKNNNRLELFRTRFECIHPLSSFWFFIKKSLRKYECRKIFRKPVQSLTMSCWWFRVIVKDFAKVQRLIAKFWTYILQCICIFLLLARLRTLKVFRSFKKICEYPFMISDLRIICLFWSKIIRHRTSRSLKSVDSFNLSS